MRVVNTDVVKVDCMGTGSMYVWIEEEVVLTRDIYYSGIGEETRLCAVIRECATEIEKALGIDDLFVYPDIEELKDEDE